MPSYDLPSRKTIPTLIPKEYKKVMLEIIEDIKECDIKSIAITTDMWTSLANKGFITITCHIIN